MAKTKERLDDNGLYESDYVMRDRIIQMLDVQSHEKSGLTKDLVNWHKGWDKVVNSSQSRFNLMRRLQCANEHGDCQCVCTGQWFPYTGIDAGHFISATKQATRFEPMNVHPQSKASNQYDTSNDSLIDYTMFMQERYGKEAVNELRAKAKAKPSKKWNESQEELLALRIVWKREIKKHQKRLGI